MQRDKKIEILIASLFLVLLLLISTIIFLNNSSSVKYSSNSVVIQTINYPSKIVNCEVKRTPYEVIYDVGEVTRTTTVKSEKLSYEDSSNSYTKEGLFANGVEVYEVKVKNTGCAGGYFKVEMSFVDSCGKTQTEFIRKYVDKNKETLYRYTNLNREKEFKSWSYKVTPADISCYNEEAKNIVTTQPRTAIKTNYITELECLRI